MSQSVFTLAHTFDAPKESVFAAFTTAEALNQWWGPTISRNSVLSLDFRPGGIFRYKMEGAQGTSYGRFLYHTIQPHDLLEFTVSFTDADGNVVAPAFAPDFPLGVRYRFEFNETGDKTKVEITGVPENATEKNLAAFNGLGASMKVGFGGTMEQLAKYLESVSA
ncbi:SRPBCC domain-containing protein [Chitinophaga sedimenti]|uniref:SRPBCC family protein n=1 Tax=Chitinophaga sedimenti TaxID=2033606 RepID=UPI0020062764|nr:SRPBCC domain-containing protein [Chitinophaga sedimenti]MCK7554208.1 SRPBCC domain-containing protein [Chitinophaga sedimenti]